MRIFILITFLLFKYMSFAQTGIVWSSAQDVAMSHHDNQHPRIVIDGSGNPLIIWGKLSSKECMFSRWDSTMFTLPVALNPMSIPVFTASFAGPDIASKGDTVYVVYKETPEDTTLIYVISSFDRGVNFSSPVPVDLSIAPDNSRFPTITVDELGNPMVAYMRFDMGFMNARWVIARSTDFGNSFSTDVLASGWSGGTVCDCCPGSIVSNGNSVTMLYRDNLNNMRDIWCGISSDSGNTFTIGFNIDQNNWMINACPSTGPDGVVIGDTLYTVYMNGANGDKVYMSSSSLSAMTSQTTQLAQLNANFPRISNSDKAVAVVWRQSNMGNTELALQFTNNMDSGLSVLYDTLAMDGVENADVIVHEGKVHVVWEDNNSGTVKYQMGTYTPLTTSVSEQNNNTEVVIYPNPVTSSILNVVSSDKDILKYSIIKVLGTIVISKQVTTKNLSIDLSSLSSGPYFIQIDTKNTSSRSKFFKQ